VDDTAKCLFVALHQVDYKQTCTVPVLQAIFSGDVYHLNPCFHWVLCWRTKQFNNLFQSFFHIVFLSSSDLPNPAASQNPR
jgi:hypothetical protein